MALHPTLTPKTDNAMPNEAKKQPARAAGPQNLSRMALSRSHWFQYAWPNLPCTAAVAPIPKKKMSVLLANMEDACLHPASLGLRVYRVRSGCCVLVSVHVKCPSIGSVRTFTNSAEVTPRQLLMPLSMAHPRLPPLTWVAVVRLCA